MKKKWGLLLMLMFINFLSYCMSSSGDGRKLSLPERSRPQPPGEYTTTVFNPGSRRPCLESTFIIDSPKRGLVHIRLLRVADEIPSDVSLRMLFQEISNRARRARCSTIFYSGESRRIKTCLSHYGYSEGEVPGLESYGAFMKKNIRVYSDSSVEMMHRAHSAIAHAAKTIPDTEIKKVLKKIETKDQP